MSEKQSNKDINNVEKYVYLENLNESNLNTCFEYLNKYLGEDESIDFDELVAVCDFTYEKSDDGNKDSQIAEVLDYIGVSDNKRVSFWVTKCIKYNGLRNWAEYMQTKFVSEGE